MNFCLSCGVGCVVNCNSAMRSGLHWYLRHGVRLINPCPLAVGVWPVLPYTYLHRGIWPVIPSTYVSRGVRLVSALKMKRTGRIAGCGSSDILQLCERDRCQWHYNGPRVEQWFTASRRKGATGRPPTALSLGTVGSLVRRSVKPLSVQCRAKYDTSFCCTRSMSSSYRHVILQRFIIIIIIYCNWVFTRWQ
jgi:hypothetical protein